MNLRERSKIEKLHRIKSAARMLFEEQGFDATTIRQIADRSGVGLATLFLYATDKRDLLFLTCNDELAALTQRAFSDTIDNVPLLESLTIVFRHFFIFYSANRVLSRDLLRELTFFTGGQHSDRFQAIRASNVTRISAIIDREKADNKIANTHETAKIAEVIFFVFAAEVRQWLAQETKSAEEGVRRLSQLLAIVVDGVSR
jgi:AcrR family transcriptional regulator